MTVSSVEFAKMQQISRNVVRISKSNDASFTQTVRALNKINSSSDQATTEVISNAMDLRDTATSAKGRIIDLMA